MKNWLREIIGRVSRKFYQVTALWAGNTIDNTRTNYSWWDQFRYGKQTGYEYIGPLAQSAYEIYRSYILGRSVRIQLDEVDDARMQQKLEYTNASLIKFTQAVQPLLSKVCEDMFALGDQFVIVNPDSSLQVIPPNTVEIEREKVTVNKEGTFVIQPELYRIITNYDDVRVVEEWTTKTRRITYSYTGENQKPVERVEVYPNLIGRIPIVHFANARGSNELFGRPLFDSIRSLSMQIDDMSRKGFSGTKISGNPIPVFENLIDPEATIEANATTTDETYVDGDGDEQSRTVMAFDEDTVIVLGEGGRFVFASPEVGFSQDIRNMVNLGMELMQDYLHVPRHLMGGTEGITEGEAAAKNDPWVEFVEGMRDMFAGIAGNSDIGTKAQGGLHELIEIWLETRKLVDRKIFVGPTKIRWHDLLREDERIKFEKVKFAHSRRQITDVTALELLDLVEDANAEVELARTEERALDLQAFDDFEGGNDLNQDGSQDDRQAPGAGASAPRMPAYAGGGQNGNN